MSTSPRAKPLQPQHQVYTTFEEVKQDLHALFQGMQQLNHRIVAAAPNVSQIDEGQII
jgi:hypothetical protein